MDEAEKLRRLYALARAHSVSGLMGPHGISWGRCSQVFREHVETHFPWIKELESRPLRTAVISSLVAGATLDQEGKFVFGEEARERLSNVKPTIHLTDPAIFERLVSGRHTIDDMLLMTRNVRPKKWKGGLTGRPRGPPRPKFGRGRRGGGRKPR